MYNSIKYKSFELFLEEVSTTTNTDKETKLKDYTDKVNNYNAKKNNFKNILTKDQKVWEEEASKIIDGNIYLGAAWKIAKINKQIEEKNDKIKSGDLTQEEVRETQEKIKEYQKDLNDAQNDVKNKIRDDLKNIQKS